MDQGSPGLPGLGRVRGQRIVLQAVTQGQHSLKWHSSVVAHRVAGVALHHKQRNEGEHSLQSSCYICTASQLHLLSSSAALIPAQSGTVVMHRGAGWFLGTGHLVWQTSTVPAAPSHICSDDVSSCCIRRALLTALIVQVTAPVLHHHKHLRRRYQRYTCMEPCSSEHLFMARPAATTVCR